MLAPAVLVAALAAAATLATPVEKRQLAPAPTVTIKNGTVVGSTNTLQGVDSFMGIPFAQPPVGNLRLRNPVPVSTTFGTLTATGTPTSCPNFIKSMPKPSGLSAATQDLLNELPLFQAASGPMGEDCLTINVLRPSTVKAGSNVPVLAYIYGGGFEAGSASMYNQPSIVQHGAALGKPFVYVTMLNAFGWLAGKELAGNANLGLKDQRLALKWIQENIAAFGGDPGKVTIWGESAGAISVFDQFIINGGDNTYNGKPLFVGGIMNSGSVVPALNISSLPAQTIYNTVVLNAGCSGAADTLQCLRQVPYKTFLSAAQTVPGIFDYQSLDLSYLPRPDPSDSFFPISPEQAVVQKKYSRTPFILGDQEDEGTLFSLVQSNISNTDQLVTYLASYFPEAPRSATQKLVNAYPDDPTQGSPFNTGPLYNVYPEFKRLAAILGDITFTLTRRVYLGNATMDGIPAWSYINSYLQGTPILGTFHGSDILNDREVAFAPLAQQSQLTYYTSFTYYQDPNRIANAAYWPRWNTSSKQLLNFTSSSILLAVDNFRQKQYDTLVSLTNVLRV